MKKIIVLGLVACLLILVQGCSPKDEETENSEEVTETPTGNTHNAENSRPNTHEIFDWSPLPDELIDENNALTLLDFRNIKMGATFEEMFEIVGEFHGVVHSNPLFSVVHPSQWFYQLSDASLVVFATQSGYVDRLPVRIHNKFRIALYQYNPYCEISYARFAYVFNGWFDDLETTERRLCFDDILTLSFEFSSVFSNEVTGMSPDISSSMSQEEIIETLGIPNGFAESDPLRPFYKLYDGVIVVFAFSERTEFFTISVIDPVGSVLETVHNYNLQARQ
jgi:hypothetical protein